MAQAKSIKGVEVLVLCVDRDDDLGKKAGIKGPIIGEEENLKAARALALADPEDSDLNAIFSAVKTKKEAEGVYRGVEVVTLTGDMEVGVKSDQRILQQLLEVLKRFSPKGVVFVTDGAEDEEIIPIVQGETKILSVKTVTVKQAKPLESAYFKILDFFGKVAENPKQARMVFGVPGILLFIIVLLSYLGLPIVEILLALLGIYLLAKGFGYEDRLFSGLNEVKNSLLLGGNIYRVFNLIAVFILVLSLITGYLQLQNNLSQIRYQPGHESPVSSVSEALTKQTLLSLNFLFFSSGGVDFSTAELMLIAFSIIALGFIIHNFLTKNYLRIKKHLYILLVAVLIKYLFLGGLEGANKMYWTIIYLKADSTFIPRLGGFDPVSNLLVSLLVSFVVLLVSHYILKIVFFDYVERKKKLEERFLGREVYDKEGKKLGEVGKIDLAGSELKGVFLKRRYYPVDDLTIKGKVLMAKEI